MNRFYSSYGIGFGASTWFQELGPLLIVLVLWSLFWKGLALWHSGRRGQSGWFIVLLIINSLGILELIYLFLIAKLTWNQLFNKKI